MQPTGKANEYGKGTYSDVTRPEIMHIEEWRNARDMQNGRTKNAAALADRDDQ